MGSERPEGLTPVAGRWETGEVDGLLIGALVAPDGEKCQRRICSFPPLPSGEVALKGRVREDVSWASFCDGERSETEGIPLHVFPHPNPFLEGEGVIER